MTTGKGAIPKEPRALSEEQLALWDAQVEAVRREPNEVILLRALKAAKVIPRPWRYGLIGDLYMARVSEIAPTMASAALYSALRQFSTHPMSHEACVAVILNEPDWRRYDHPKPPVPPPGETGPGDDGQTRRPADGPESG